MNQVNKIICYTSAQANWWKKRIDPKKAIFIPYVIEEREKLLSTVEKDYIFSGGASSRDYATLVRVTKKS